MHPLGHAGEEIDRLSRRVARLEEQLNRIDRTLRRWATDLHTWCPTTIRDALGGESDAE